MSELIDETRPQFSIKNSLSKKSIIHNVFDMDYVDQTDLSTMQNDADAHKVRPLSNDITCPDCHKSMFKAPAGFLCEMCGRIDDDNYDTDKIEYHSDYNTSSTSAAPVCITGPGSYMFQKKLISNTSNYKKQQKRNTIDQIENIIYQYKGPKPAQYVVREAAELYYQVQQHCIKRGDVRKGTMAACLYRKCKKYSIDRKPKEIADMFGIPQSELSNGEKILDQLFAEGRLGGRNDSTYEASINQFYFSEQEQMNSFLSRYFECLVIPEQYLIFAQRLIRFTIKYHIAESSIMSSKCAGTIYLLSIRLPHLNIKRNIIEQECRISKSTFTRFSQSIIAYLKSSDVQYKKARSRLRRIFKKNSIPLA
jgi:transcription initiation factor TFIIIB Brf1 subunit/transcription initiation factor TFIIB